MSVDNIFSSEMYHNDQWYMIHNGNVISIKCFKNYFTDEKNIIKKLSVWISVSCYGSTPRRLLCRPRCYRQVKKLQEN